MLFHIGRTAAGTRWGMGVGWVSFFCFHNQGIWIDAKIVKIWEYARKFCYGYFDNPYNSFIRFQRFRFSSDDLQKYKYFNQGKDFSTTISFNIA